MGVIQDMYLNDIHKGREAFSETELPIARLLDLVNE
jgi:hypothetical protein